MPQRLAETTPLSEAGTATSKGTIRVRAISAGLGSSGLYSPEVLEQAATDQLITRGTFLHVDHASQTERHDRPERSVSTIAGVFTEAATYDADTESLVGEVQLFEPYRERLMEMAPYIGLSISGSATDVTEGEYEGKRVPVIEGLHSIDSVDFVTRAGRGGQVLLECARPSDVVERAVRHGVTEATADERREQLTDAVRSAHGGEDRYVWIRDFDDTRVWFEVHADDEASHTYEQTYDVADDDLSVTLTGDHEERRAVTKYVPTTAPNDDPVTRPGSNTDTTAQESEEDTMPKKEIEESEYNRLIEADGRVSTLESERDTAIAERDAERRRNRAMDLVREHDHAFTPLEARGLVAELPLTEAGDFDEEAFTTTLTEHAATSRAAAGEGQVSGFGQTTDTGKSTTESAPARSKSAWGRPVTEQKGA